MLVWFSVLKFNVSLITLVNEIRLKRAMSWRPWSRILIKVQKLFFSWKWVGINIYFWLFRILIGQYWFRFENFEIFEEKFRHSKIWLRFQKLEYILCIDKCVLTYSPSNYLCISRLYLISGFHPSIKIVLYLHILLFGK